MQVELYKKAGSRETNVNLEFSISSNIIISEIYEYNFHIASLY